MERTHRTNSVKEVVARSLLGESILLANKTSPTRPCCSSTTKHKIQPPPQPPKPDITVFSFKKLRSKNQQLVPNPPISIASSVGVYPLFAHIRVPLRASIAKGNSSSIRQLYFSSSSGKITNLNKSSIPIRVKSVSILSPSIYSSTKSFAVFIQPDEAGGCKISTFSSIFFIEVVRIF